MKNAKALLPWKLWSLETPKEPGVYWLAGYWPARHGEPFNYRFEEPIVWDVGIDEISGRYDIVNVHGYAANNLIWFGPLKPPEIGKAGDAQVPACGTFGDPTKTV